MRRFPGSLCCATQCRECSVRKEGVGPVLGRGQRSMYFARMPYWGNFICNSLCLSLSLSLSLSLTLCLCLSAYPPIPLPLCPSASLIVSLSRDASACMAPSPVQPAVSSTSWAAVVSRASRRAWAWHATAHAYTSVSQQGCAGVGF